LQLIRIGFNLKGYGSATNRLVTLVFWGSIVAALLAIARYWLAGTIFELLGTLSAISVVSIVTGSKALKGIASDRLSA